MTIERIRKNPNLLLEGLNPPQKEVVEHHKGPILAAAVAGAGKTTVLVKRMAYMMAKHNEDGERMLAVTFSRKGADEMNERLNVLVGSNSGARVGTFHSLAYQIVRSEVEETRDFAIDNRNKYRFCIKDATGYKGMKWDDADVTLLEDFIAKAKTNLMRPTSDGIHDLAKQLGRNARKTAGNPYKMVEAYYEAEELRRQRMLITFDDMLLDAVELLRDDDNIRRRWADKWDFVLQDEAQDQNLGQLLLGEMLAKDHRNYLLVGDPAQCHPPGTMIDTGDGEVPIEKLWAWQEGEEITVRSWNRNAQKMVAGRKARLGSRVYHGTLYEMHVGNRSVKMTDNHKVICRWTDRNDDSYAVYLMYREGFGYRVGHCKMFSNKGFHFATRARLEKADKAWIISIHDNAREASIEESIVAATYGIPTATFEPVNNNKNLDEEAIRRIFNEVDSRPGAERCLSTNDMSPAFPFWPFPPQQVDGKSDSEVAYRRSTYFPVYACNIIPGMMSVPLPDDRNQWETVRMVQYHRDYNGLVYSMDVEKDHSYAANGIVVLNCIYTWRGAHPEKLLTFEDRWGAHVVLMDRNYRCGQTIIDVANKSLAGMDPATKLEMEMQCCRTENGEPVVGTVTSRQFLDLDDEGENVVADIVSLTEDGDFDYKDIVILYRTNAQSRGPEEALLSSRIPYEIIGGANFYERREVKCLLGYLRLAAGKGDMEDIRRCINAPFRYLGRAFIDKVEEAVNSQGQVTNLLEAVRTASSRARIQSRQKKSAAEWANLIHSMEQLINQGRSYTERCKAEQGESGYIDEAKPARLLETVLQITRYTDWLRRDEGEETTQNSRVSNVRELVRAAERFPTVDELLEYIDRNIAESRKQRKSNDQPNKVTLMSIHRSKGMEFPVVFLIGASDGILPHARCEDDSEERRLFYVAATRARDELHVSCVSRMAIGDKIKFLMPSPYLAQAGIPPVQSGELARDEARSREVRQELEELN